MRHLLGVVFAIFLIKGGFAQVPFSQARFLTALSKGNAVHPSKLQDIGHYGIKHGDCFTELDSSNVKCPPQSVLAAVKIEVEDSGREVDIVIPEAVIGTVYESIPILASWRIGIARRGDVCRSVLKQAPALVTVYVACNSIVVRATNKAYQSRILVWDHKK